MARPARPHPLRRIAVAPYPRAPRHRPPTQAHPLRPLIWGALGVVLPLYWLAILAWGADALF